MMYFHETLGLMQDFYVTENNNDNLVLFPSVQKIH